VVERKDVNKDLRGYLLLDEGIYMIASASITDGSKRLPPIGTSVILRFLSPSIVQKIEATTQLKAQLFLPRMIQTIPQLKTAYEDALANPQGMMNRPVNETQLEGFFVIKDIHNQPIGMFRLIKPRPIFLTGQRSIQYFFMMMVIFGILVSLVLLWLMHILILNRLAKLASNLEIIGAKNELSHRVDERGNDELSSVSRVINQMLSIIQASQEKLENRVQERTVELQSTNKNCSKK